MAYCGYVTKLKEVRPHSNADRLQVASCFGNSTIVGLDAKEGDIVIYFPTDGRLSVEYCTENNLLRKKDEEGNNIGGYLDERRHVSTLKLRGEMSDGLVMQLGSLSTFCDTSKLKEGDTIDTINGKLICEKYVSVGKTRNQNTPNVKNRARKTEIQTEFFPFFEQHIDTSQLAYNTHQLKEGDLCYITLKCHGTSARIMNALKETKTTLPHWMFKILKKLKINLPPKQSYEYVSGTRRVTLKSFSGGYYGDDSFRKRWHDFFVGKLHKNETVFFEIVGYTDKGGLIMPECNNEKTKDKAFIKQYGKTTKFTYGCEVGESKILVYRMTMANVEGEVFEYPTELIKTRCEQMGTDFVTVFDKFIFTTVEDMQERVDKYIDGVDPIGKTHVREGIVLRVENGGKFKAFKSKNYSFKVLEGIIKEANILDMEEAESEGINE